MKSNFFLTGIIFFLFAVLSVHAAVNPIGPQTTLVILVNFTDAAVQCTATQINDIVFNPAVPNSVNSFYLATSSGLTSFVGTTAGPFTIPYPKGSVATGCDMAGWTTAAKAAATASGVNLNDYAHIVIQLPITDCVGGAANICGVSPNNLAYVSFACSEYSKQAYAHELGHSLCMQHASTPTLEYGDTTDVMGTNYYELNAPHGVQLGFIPATHVLTSPAAGVYTIASTETDSTQTNLPQAIRFPIGTNNYEYISFRQPTGAFDSVMSVSYANKLSVHTLATGGHTFLLTALGDGQSYHDPTNLIFTMISHTPSTATVQVDASQLICIPALPIVKITPPAFNVVGTPAVPFAISVENKDSVSCPSTTFNLAGTIPPAWPGILTPLSLTLAPGEIGTASLRLNPPNSTPLGTYHFSVSAMDAGNVNHMNLATGSYTILSSIPDASAPTTPVLSLSKIKKIDPITGAKLIAARLSWTASTDNVGVTQYVIYRGEDELATVSGNTLRFIDNTVVQGQGYYYTVYAKDAVGNSSLPGVPQSIFI